MSDFAGRVSRQYRRYRRDVSEKVIGDLASRAGWSEGDCVIDLGCGTGQVAVPLASRVGSVIACDVEPDQLWQLRARLRDEAVINVVPCLLGDAELGALATVTSRMSVSGLVVANALHWMDERTLFAGLPRLLRPGGVLAIITHGPPLWLGDAPWQRAVRRLVEELLGPVSAACGSDENAVRSREVALLDAGYRVDVQRHETDYEIDSGWVLGHLLSAVSADQIDDDMATNLGRLIEQVVPPGSTERVATSTITASIPQPRSALERGRRA